jgi:hypothetical protein
VSVHLPPLEKELRRYKALAESAMAQVDDAALNRATPGFDNSIAVLVWHISGNLKSRFTEFLATDGEKPWRHRDEEFVARSVSRAALLAKWEDGWGVLLGTLAAMTDEDLARQISIRKETMSAQDALLRALAHLAYHVGQIVYLAKAAKGGTWEFLTIPPGKSEEFNAQRQRRSRGRRLCGSELSFDTTVRDQPDQRHDDVQCIGQPDIDEREADRRHIERE